MSRPARQLVLMQSAYLWAQRSTCSRLNVGCVIERDGRILVQGYNGAPAGLEHCNHDCDCPDGYPHTNEHQEIVHYYRSKGPQCPAIEPCLRAVHAEQNAIAFAARHGVGLSGSSAWITNQPCVSCAQSLINAGVEAVMFYEQYRLKAGTDLLREAGIEVYDMGLMFPDWDDKVIR